MWFSKRPSGKYSALNKYDAEECELGETSSSLGRTAITRRHTCCFSGACLFLLCVFVEEVGLDTFNTVQTYWPQLSRHVSQKQTQTTCKSPAIRREWRSLSMKEKHMYLEAVQCLAHTPSKFTPNMTLYDDFPHVHDTTGAFSHDAAPFLPWHRYFIHLYELALRESCGYEGVMTYWDWTLDWETPTAAPVWDLAHGFGGDSRPHSRPSQDVIVGQDRCVVDGPFAGLQVHWFGEHDNPHCLSRGFLDKTDFDSIGNRFSPAAVEQVMSRNEYHDFFQELEDGPHLAIPHGVGGDFFFTVAPYDPVFILHHTQLDRLWWRWQQAHPSRQMAYSGPARHGSEDAASLDDMLPMSDLAKSIKVREVMDTESGFLCYRY